MKKTLVLGASNNPTRYSHKATTRLSNAGHETLPLGIKKGDINGITIENDLVDYEAVDTVTLYLNPKRQVQYYDY